MLIGSPGARKSTAIKIATRLAKEAGVENIAANKTTKEKFLLDLYGHKDDSGTLHNAQLTAQQGRAFQNLFGDTADSDEDKQCEILIAADEFTNFTGAGNYEFISLLGELWDCPDSYVNRVKNSKSFLIANPCVNILSGNTPTGFAAAFPPEVIGQGFISRLILVYGERTQERITIPKAPDALLHNAVVEQLMAIKNECSGAVTMDAAAFDAIDWLYKNWEDLDDLRFANYSSRRLTHLLKLCMVLAAMRLSIEICLDDVILANTLLTITEEEMPKALGEFGKGKFSDVANKIVEFLQRSNEPRDAAAVWKHVSTDLENMRQLVDIMQGLVKAEKVQTTKLGFLPIRRVKKETGRFFNAALLRKGN